MMRASQVHTAHGSLRLYQCSDSMNLASCVRVANHMPMYGLGS
jgi:hypothetical protein